MAEELVQALVPLFFVLLLGYVAGRHHRFRPEQAAGFNLLLVDYALPALLFSSLLKVPRASLVENVPALATVAVSFTGTYAVVYLLARRLGRHNRGGAALAALCVTVPAASFFGPALLPPLFGLRSSVIIAIGAVVINVLQTPFTIVLLDANAAQAAAAHGHAVSASDQPHTLRIAGNALLKPVVVAPILAVLVVLVGIPIPVVLASSIALIGSTTAGVAIFASGLTLAAHRFVFTRQVALLSAGKLIFLPFLVGLLALLFRVKGSVLVEAVVMSSLSSGLISIILASRYEEAIEQTASVVLLTALCMIGSIPLWFFLGDLLASH